MPYDAEVQNRARRIRRDRMRRIVPQVKLFLGCSECGYSAHADALQFDHIIPIGNLRMMPWQGNSSWAALWRFVLDGNVDVKCANCHAIKSAAEQRQRTDILPRGVPVAV